LIVFTLVLYRDDDWNKKKRKEKKRLKRDGRENIKHFRIIMITKRHRK